MTPAERAKKIPLYAQYSGLGDISAERRKETYSKIAAQIEEAVREALEMKVHSLAKECQAWYERGQVDQISRNAFQFGKVEGFALVRDQAAKIADAHCVNHCDCDEFVQCTQTVAKEIRAMEAPK